MPRKEEIDCSTIGVDRKYHSYYATCWPCKRINVPVNLDHVSPEKLVTRLKPRCLRCGQRGSWIGIPKITEAMRPR